MKKFKKFINFMNWKFLLVTTGVFLIIFLFLITLIVEKPIRTISNQQIYPLRSNVISVITIIFYQSSSSDFSKTLTDNPGYLTLFLLALMIFLFVLGTIPKFFRKISKKLRINLTCSTLTIIVIFILISQILLMVQKDHYFSSRKYIYLISSLKFQGIYFLPYIGYLLYFPGLIWYLVINNQK